MFGARRVSWRVVIGAVLAVLVLPAFALAQMEGTPDRKG